MRFWSEEMAKIANAITTTLKDRGQWESRYAIMAYVDMCIAAGFCKTDNDMRLCAERYINGKRKITPPGTAKRKKQTRNQTRLLNNPPNEMMVSIRTVIAQQEKIVAQVKAGNEKAVNSLIGKVMGLYKYDATVVKQLLLKEITCDG